MKNKIDISIVIATYNSEKILPVILKSIKKQNLQKLRIEKIIVDGGSTDSTLKISKEYKCRVINNPQKNPVYAKYYGYISSKGKFIIFLDHDEELNSKNSIYDKYQCLANNNKVKIAFGSGYKSPKKYPFINSYINEFGDPFSFYIYRLSKDFRFFIKTMRDRYKVADENNKYIIFQLNISHHVPLFELVAGGTMVNGNYLKRKYPLTKKRVYMLGQAYNLIFQDSPFIAILKQDTITHYSSENFSIFLNKIRWRVKNNINKKDLISSSGFLGREKYQPRLFKYKKYFYIPYTLFLFPVLLDTFWLMLTRQEIKYVLHFPLSIYTSICVIYYYSLNLLNSARVAGVYDGRK